MEPRFHHWIKKKKKGNCNFLYHNSDFFFSELRYKLAIASYKVRIVRYKLAVLTFFINLQLQERNFIFFSSELDFITRNWEFISHSQNCKKKRQNCEMQTRICGKKSELWVFIPLYDLQLWVYISQFWEKKVRNVSLYLCKLAITRKKSELSDKKSQLPFLVFIQWQKQASIRWNLFLPLS